MNRVLLTGKSMKPFFRPGDILAVETAQVEKLKVGNVIVFQSPKMKEPMVHRIIGRKAPDGRTFFVTRGDNNPRLKERVFPEWVMGRVIGKFRSNRLVTISRPEELLSLPLSAWYRKVRLLSLRPCRKLVSLLYPLLPLRVLSLGRGKNSERRMAVFLGNVVAEKKMTVEGGTLWVHPLFRETAIADRIGASETPPHGEIHGRA